MRFWGCLLAVIAAGVPVIMQMAVPASERAGWYGIAVTFVGLAMCWGGVEAARWMLRESPAAKSCDIASDWTKLWLFAGIPGGGLMIFWLLFGWLTHNWLNPVYSTVILGMALLGPALWLISSPWMLGEFKLQQGRNSMALQIGGLAVAIHFLGVFIAMYGYPHLAGASIRTLIALASSLSSLYPLAFFHLLLIGVIHRITLRFGILRVR